jgi:thioesterase DpgC
MNLKNHPGYSEISQECKAWVLDAPTIGGSPTTFVKDKSIVCAFLTQGIRLQRPKFGVGLAGPCSEAEIGFVNSISDDVRNRFLGVHRADIYADLTDGFSTSIRVEALVNKASIKYSGLLSSIEQMKQDSERRLKDKVGYERSIGIFLSHMFADPCAGNHLIQTMLQPLPRSIELLEKFTRDDVLDLGMAIVKRNGASVEVRMHNPQYLNAEDTETLSPMEQAIDIAILDPHSEICVLRGTKSPHPRYKDRGIFCSGINLTHLYEGKIPYLWYITRDLGFVNKMAHGLWTESTQMHDPMPTLEKPWIAAVETFAIGGGCQYLLVMDHTLAEETAYFTLPARKEGIIPGLANMRLPRLIGDRLSRQAIMFDRRINANSPEGLLIADQIVPDGAMDEALSLTIKKLTSSGVVSAAGNRKALRVCQETLDDVRMYMAVYSREQANCHLSPALVNNLEENWLKPKNNRTH